MRVNDVAHFTIADVLRQVDHKAALRVYAAQRASEERENPPIGTWKLDPAFGTFEVLVLVDPGLSKSARATTSTPARFHHTTGSGLPRAVYHQRSRSFGTFGVT